MTRLAPFILLGYVVVGVQAGLGGFVRLGGAAPNFVLIVAAFLALFLDRRAAGLACFALGLMQDLLTQQTLGLYALSYGLMAMVVSSTAAMVYREHPLTHVAIALAASVFTWLLLLVHGWVFPPSPGMAAALLGTFLTALFAAPVTWLLLRLRPALGLRAARRW
jgi:rod shape-determining protein MreD